MINNMMLKLKRADNSIIKSFAKIIYSNIIKVNRFVIYELDVNQDFTLPPLESHFSIKIIHNRDLYKYLPKGKYLSREFEIHKIHGIKHCVIVLKDNEVCHISWIYMHGDHNRWFDLNKNEASLNYSFTFPEFRGKNLLPHAILASVKWLRTKGISRLLEAPHEHTIYTIRSFEKISTFRKVGVLSQWFVFRPTFSNMSINKI